jgi:hypothetical protein
MSNSIPRAAARVLAAALCLTLLSGAFAAPGLGSSPVHFQRESYQALLVQLRHGEVHAVVLHPQGYKAHASLNDGGHFTATYSPAEVSKLEALARAHNASFTVASSTRKATATHHKLRYIAGGILIVVILIVLAVLLIGRRRALSEEEVAETSRS